MLVTQLNLMVTGLQNINKASLHTGDPGNLGDNDSGETKQTLVWSTPARGYMRATVEFVDVPAGTYTHVGLWDDSEFIHARPLNVTLPDPQNLRVLVEFTVEAKS
jgi:hypothetical protein